MNQRSKRIQDLFPRPVIVEEDNPAHWDPEKLENPVVRSPEPVLYPEEEAAIARAVNKRRREFTAGRVCARRALQRLGIPSRALPPNPDRSPPWPEGIVGSITHTSEWCGVVVTQSSELRGVGIDAEPASPIEQELFKRICTTRELAWLANQPAEQRGLLGRTIFSAKEAFYKAQYLETSQFLGFQDVELEFKRGLTQFEAIFQVSAADRFRPGDRIDGCVEQLDDLIITVAWIV